MLKNDDYFLQKYNRHLRWRAIPPLMKREQLIKPGTSYFTIDRQASGSPALDINNHWKITETTTGEELNLIAGELGQSDDISYSREEILNDLKEAQLFCGVNSPEKTKSLF